MWSVNGQVPLRTQRLDLTIINNPDPSILQFRALVLITGVLQGIAITITKVVMFLVKRFTIRALLAARARKIRRKVPETV
jgi:hypothetical protein